MMAATIFPVNKTTVITWRAAYRAFVTRWSRVHANFFSFAFITDYHINAILYYAVFCFHKIIEVDTALACTQGNFILIYTKLLSTSTKVLYNCLKKIALNSLSIQTACNSLARNIIIAIKNYKISCIMFPNNVISRLLRKCFLKFRLFEK